MIYNPCIDGIIHEERGRIRSPDWNIHLRFMGWSSTLGPYGDTMLMYMPLGGYWWNMGDSHTIVNGILVEYEFMPAMPLGESNIIKHGREIRKSRTEGTSNGKAAGQMVDCPLPCDWLLQGNISYSPRKSWASDAWHKKKNPAVSRVPNSEASIFSSGKRLKASVQKWSITEKPYHCYWNILKWWTYAEHPCQIAWNLLITRPGKR